MSQQFQIEFCIGDDISFKCVMYSRTQRLMFPTRPGTRPDNGIA